MVSCHVPFFKVVVLSVNLEESEIVLEQNFDDRAEADSLAQQWCADDNVTLVINCK